LYSINYESDVKVISNEIKSRLSVLDLGAKLFPGHRLGKTCKSPLRDDRSPSFSVYDNGQRWKDFTTGEGGDVFDLYQAATGVDASAAFIALRDMTLGGVAVIASVKQIPARPEDQKAPYHPKLEGLTAIDIKELSRLRGIPTEGLQLAVGGGFLWAADYGGQRCWIITDKTHKVYLARRFDGGLWDNGAKSKTLPGGQASWPIGVEEAATFPAIALTEGGPDFLAAFGHAWNSGVETRVAPVCMTGASVSIPDETLARFKGKRVRIFIHSDSAGAAAFNKWGSQLYGTAAKLDGFEFEAPAKDLNDLSTRQWTDAFDFAHEEVENAS
jgi:hypothetical protein